MAGNEKVYLRVGGEDWYGWLRVAVQAGVENAVRSFAATVTDGSSLDAAWNFMPDEKVEVFNNGSLVVSGFIDSLVPSFEDTNHKIEVTGRSKASSSVDSSHEHKTGEFKNVTILDVAKQLDTHGVGYSSDVSLPKVQVFRLEPGETVFSAIERLARKQGLLLVGQPDGSVQITKAKGKMIHPALVQGVNVLGGSATFDNSDRHSKVKVKGQRAYGQQPLTSLRIEGQATDTGTKRDRTKVIIHEQDGDPKDADQRARWYRDRSYAKSITASIKVQGWHDSNGVLWTPNTIIPVDVPLLKLKRDMLIAQIDYAQDENGTFAQLSLKDPGAYGGSGSPAKTNKGGSMWTNPNSNQEAGVPSLGGNFA